MVKNFVTSTGQHLSFGRKSAAVVAFLVVALTLALLLVPQISAFACGGLGSCPCPGC